MGFLTGKKLLITGVISNRSIAYGIAEACRREGAELAFTYVGERFRDRVAAFAEEFGSSICLPMDVSSDEEIAAVVEELKNRWGVSTAWCIRSALRPAKRSRATSSTVSLATLSRRPWILSAYSFPALAKACLPLMEGRNASVLTLTYLGSERVVPNYNTMGLAKAALEASTRYLASSLGPKGIRANAISAGPIKTLAASGIQDFSKLLHIMEEAAPLGRTVTIQEVGNTAAFLLSDLASGITGDIIYVDAGFHAVAVGAPVGK